MSEQIREELARIVCSESLAPERATSAADECVSRGLAYRTSEGDYRPTEEGKEEFRRWVL